MYLLNIYIYMYMVKLVYMVNIYIYIYIYIFASWCIHTVLRTYLPYGTSRSYSQGVRGLGGRLDRCRWQLVVNVYIFIYVYTYVYTYALRKYYRYILFGNCRWQHVVTYTHAQVIHIPILFAYAHVYIYPPTSPERRACGTTPPSLEHPAPSRPRP